LTSNMKILKGKVVSKKMAKTATVEVDRIIIHKMYKKRVRRTKKYHVHDELGVEVGQSVRFIPTKPYSKLKKWKIIEIEKLQGLEKSKKNKRSKK